jgi:excisionase family DNA binding protein
MGMKVDLAELTDEQLLSLLKSPQVTDLLKARSPWMTPDEAATYLGVALGTLRNWTSARFIPFARRGRIVRYHRDAIDKWLAKGACPGRASLADI